MHVGCVCVCVCACVCVGPQTLAYSCQRSEGCQRTPVMLHGRIALRVFGAQFAAASCVRMHKTRCMEDEVCRDSGQKRADLVSRLMEVSMRRTLESPLPCFALGAWRAAWSRLGREAPRRAHHAREAVRARAEPDGPAQPRGALHADKLAAMHEHN